MIVDHRFFPEVALAILHPLEVGSGDAAGVGQDVGMTKTFFSERMSSAAAVVGPFAPSARILHFTRSAFWLVITFSVAAGIRISQSTSNSSAGSYFSAPGKP